MGDASKNDGRTVLYVSHNMNTIRQLCDRCIVLDKGRVVFDGNVENGINCYMNTTKTLSIVNDCSTERSKINADRQVHIDTVTLLNTDFPMYKSGDTVCVKVDYTCKRTINNLAMRMTVQAGDKTVVGLATSKPCIKAHEGANETTLNLALDWLAPGKYIVKMTAYSVNEFGSSQMHDIVDDCFAFEKVQNINDNNRMMWNHSWWGYVMFPELGVKK